MTRRAAVGEPRRLKVGAPVVLGLVLVGAAAAIAVALRITDIEHRLPGSVAVYNVQRNQVKAGGTVQIDLVVVTAVARDGFWVQDRNSKPGAFKGIWIAAGADWMAAHPEIVPGRNVEIRGAIEEYKGEPSWPESRTQIVPAPGGVTTAGTVALPTPANMSFYVFAMPDQARAYEGVLVTASSANQAKIVVDSVAPDGSVVLATGESKRKLGTMIYRPGGLKPGDHLNRVTGLVHNHDGEFELEPRGPADIERAEAKP